MPRKIPTLTQLRGSHAEDVRPSAHRRGYTRRWAKVRNRYIARHPLCENCARYGGTTPAREVDHIRPLRKGGAPYDPANLQSLCLPCHRRKTAREHGYVPEPRVPLGRIPGEGIPQSSGPAARSDVKTETGSRAPEEGR